MVHDLKSVNFTKLFNDSVEVPVNVVMPEFKYTYGGDISDVCRSMGMKQVFTPAADFSPMTTEWAKVDSIIHKARIELDRKGTKAAADYMVSLGIPKEKLCIGSPLYAMPFVTKEPVSTQAVGIPCESYRASSQPVTNIDCVQFQSEVQSDSAKPGWHQGYDEAEGAAYLYNNDATSPYYKWFLSYEDVSSLQKKLDYINQSDLAGVIVWECSQDTDDYVLISQMAQNLLRSL
jgi:GH18 family chitinase